MNPEEKQYLSLLREVRDLGHKKSDRTGTGTLSLFGAQLRFDLSAGFPLLTTKKIHLKSVIYELLWMLAGNTNVKYLQENGVRIWNEWADEHGDLGPVYGHQWRSWTGVRLITTPSGEEYVQVRAVDQMMNLVTGLKHNPDSRRHIVDTWNVTQVNDMALAPCHVLFQFYVADGRLSCQLYQRSADLFLGLPFNIASYSLLTMMMAQVCGLQPGEFIHTIGDAHIYLNHLSQVDEQLTREPRSLPRMKLNPNVEDLFSFEYGDFTLEGYDPHPAIKAPVAV